MTFIQALTDYSDLLIYPVFALVCSLFLTAGLIVILPKLGFVDKGGGRHIHKGSIPRGGGIGVILSFFMTYGLYLLNNWDSELTWSCWNKIFYPSLLVVPLGILDDRFNLKAIYKLLVQTLAVIVIFFIFHPVYTIGPWTLPAPLSFIALFIWVIVIINAFNLIDGMDGLAGGLSVVSSLCLAGWFFFDNQLPKAVGLLVLAAGCLGFLRYNFHPARIFLGDVGSTFLGLCFAVSGLSTHEGTVTLTSLLIPALAFGLPLFDVLLAIWRRSVRHALNPHNGGIMSADQDHLHHRLLRKLKKQGYVVGVLYSVEILFALGALAALIFRNTLPGIAYVLWLLVMLVVFRRLAQVELLDSAKLLQHGFAHPRRSVLLNMSHPVFDLVTISLVWGFTRYFFMPDFPIHLKGYVISVSPIILTIIGFDLYHIYWLRAGLRSFVKLVCSLTLGFIFSLSCSYYFFKFRSNASEALTFNERNFASYALIFTLMSFCLILLERFFIHYAEGFWFQRLTLENRLNEPVKATETLVYGGGLFCRLFVTYNYSASLRNQAVDEIVGIIDDDPVLTGMTINGFKVLGTAESLEKIWTKTPFSQVIVTIPEIQPENLPALKDFCQRHQVKLVRWSVEKATIPLT